MALAICQKCNKEVHWFGGKGYKLENLRHWKDNQVVSSWNEREDIVCGGELKGKLKGRENPNKGRKFIKCPNCNLRKLDHKILEQDTELWVYGSCDKRLYSQGTVVCVWCLGRKTI